MRVKAIHFWLLTGMWLAGDFFGVAGLYVPAIVLIGSSVLGWGLLVGNLIWSLRASYRAIETPERRDGG